MPLVRKGAETRAPQSVGEAAGDKLRSGDSDERWAAARALSGRPDAVATLGEALASEGDPRVREAILTALARVGTQESAEAIAPLIRSDDASLRTGAIDALRLMPQALAGLLGVLLNDPDADVRVLASDLARELPAEQATKLLSDLLIREAEANVCAAAADVLAECGTPDALPALAACAERFAQAPFLPFSMRVASDRIRAQSAPHDG